MVHSRLGCDSSISDRRHRPPGTSWAQLFHFHTLPLCLLIALTASSDCIAQPGARLLFTAQGETSGDQHGFAVAGGRDINGDQIPDLVIGANYYSPSRSDRLGRVYLHFGGPTVGTTADLDMTGSLGSEFGRSLDTALDLNGDNEADLVVGAAFASTGSLDSPGRVFVYNGGVTLDDNPDWTLTGEESFEGFGSSVAGIADFNGDGHGDLAVGSPLRSSEAFEGGRVSVFYGGPGRDTTADLFSRGSSTVGAWFGSSVVGLEDFNGDGLGDLLVLEPQTETVFLYLGNSTSPDLVADLTIIARGTVIGAVGDVNGDGLSDFAIGDSGSNGTGGRVEVYFGAASPDDAPDWILDGDPNQYLGRTVASAGDTNSDGYDDILITGGAPPGGPFVLLFLGAKNPDSVPDLLFDPASKTGRFGRHGMAGLGDLDQDGRVDIAIGDSIDAGATHVFTTDALVGAKSQSFGRLKRKFRR